MNDIQSWLDQGKTLADQATEGPWGGTWNGAREGNICGETDVLDATNVNAKDLYFITDARTRLPQALNKIGAVLELHSPMTIYSSEEECLESSEEHISIHHHEYLTEPGYYYCDALPTWESCQECRYEDGSLVEYPCSTAKALMDSKEY